MNLDHIVTPVTRPRRLRWVAWLAWLLLIACLIGFSAAQAQDANGVCRVAPAGTAPGSGTTTNSGAAWNAPMTLQTALGTPGCTEVWVKAGVYVPVVPADPNAVTDVERGVSFTLRPGVAVYGGFAGTENDRAQRQPDVNVTILSGDIDGNDNNTDGNHIVEHYTDIVGVNSLRVVDIAPTPTATTTRLDGFTITAGLATGQTQADSAGAGVGCDADTNADCRFALNQIRARGNVAAAGAGVGVTSSNAGIVDLSISDFVGADNAGLFFGSGAVVFAQGTGNVTVYVNGATLHGGVSSLAAGLSLYATDASVITASVKNVTVSAGTLIASQQGPIPSATALSLLADGSGAKVTAEVDNITVSGNPNNNPAVVAGAISAAATNGASVSLALHDSIVWDNANTNPILLGAGASLSVDHSIIDGGSAGIVHSDATPSTEFTAGTGNLDADPALGPLAANGGFSLTMLPGAGSAAVDSGNCVSNVDQRGVSRPQAGNCDIGAVEVRAAVVDVSVATAHGTLSAAAAPTLLAGAINQCAQASGSCSATYSLEQSPAPLIVHVVPATGYTIDSVSGCGGSVSNDDYVVPSLTASCTIAASFRKIAYHVGGTVTGLAGSGLVLSLNQGAQTLPISADGSFVFPTPLAAAASYAVTIASQPTAPAQTCAITNATGTIAGADVANVVVNCGPAASYSVGGNLTGLGSGGSVTLQVNGGNDLTLSANGAWVFPLAFAPGDGYLVTVSSQPQGQHCTITNASGTLAASDVGNVDVSCNAGGPALSLSVDDGHGFGRYGRVSDYYVTLANTGNGNATQVAVSANFDTAFDTANTQWICIAGAPSVSCNASGGGGFSTSLTLPAGTSVTWIVSVPVRADASEPAATFSVHAGATSAADTNTLAIFRDGFDEPYANGTAARPGNPTAAAAGADRDIVVQLPPPTADSGIDTLRRFRAGNAVVTLERLTWGTRSYVRLAARADDAGERVTGWVAARIGQPLVIGTVPLAHGAQAVLLEGAGAPRALYPAPATPHNNRQTPADPR